MSPKTDKYTRLTEEAPTVNTAQLRVVVSLLKVTIGLMPKFEPAIVNDAKPEHAFVGSRCGEEITHQLSSLPKEEMRVATQDRK